MQEAVILSNPRFSIAPSRLHAWLQAKQIRCQLHG